MAGTLEPCTFNILAESIFVESWGSQVLHRTEGDSTHPEKLKLMPRSPSHWSSCLQFFSNGSCNKTVSSFLILMQIAL